MNTVLLRIVGAVVGLLMLPIGVTAMEDLNGRRWGVAALKLVSCVLVEGALVIVGVKHC